MKELIVNTKAAKVFYRVEQFRATYKIQERIYKDNRIIVRHFITRNNPDNVIMERRDSINKGIFTVGEDSGLN